MSYWHLAMESQPVCFIVMAGYTQNPFKHVAKQGAGHEPCGRRFQPHPCVGHGAGISSDTEYGHVGLLELSIGLCYSWSVTISAWPHTLQGYAESLKKIVMFGWYRRQESYYEMI